MSFASELLALAPSQDISGPSKSQEIYKVFALNKISFYLVVGLFSHCQLDIHAVRL